MTLRWTVDLVVAAAWTVAAALLVLRSGLVGPLRAAAVLPTIIFLPGYALVSALYPRGPAVDDDRRLGTADRIALSTALSLAVVPLCVFVLNFTVGIYVRPIALAVSGVTVAFAAIAILRRAAVGSAERFGPAHLLSPTGEGRLPGGPFPLLLAGSLLLLAASGAFAAVHEQPSQEFTELYLLAENESGDLSTEAVDEAVADGRTITVAVRNQEGETVTYTVEVVGQQVEDGSVAGERSLETREFEVESGATAHLAYDVPGDVGDRFVVRLYRGAPDGSPYRSTQVWA